MTLASHNSQEEVQLFICWSFLPPLFIGTPAYVTWPLQVASEKLELWGFTHWTYIQDLFLLIAASLDCWCSQVNNDTLMLSHIGGGRFV